MFTKIKEPEDLREPDILFPETLTYRKMELWIEEAYYKDSGVFYSLTPDGVNVIIKDLLEDKLTPMHRELVVNFLAQRELLED